MKSYELLVLEYCLDGRWLVIVSTRSRDEVAAGLYRRWPKRISGIRERSWG